MIHNFDINQFLDQYWQKKPLLIRNAFPQYRSPITAEELAGLACEDFVQSRIVSELTSSPKWTLETGPFTEHHFENLPETHWTVLIQGLNKIFPEFDDLLNEFNFIPSWRVDDVMGSYAASGGSVGPHIDQYDVFLLQATGKRKWMINEEPVNEDNYIEDIPLKIIKDFEPASEWILEAGDMLYLPANVAHYGIGMEDCMTFSIGFRAPSLAELLSSYVDDNISNFGDKLRYQDPALSTKQNSGEISPEAIEKIQSLLISEFEDKSKLSEWFGCFITDYLNEHEELSQNNLNEAEFLNQFIESQQLRRPAAVRANYITLQNDDITLFINGEKFSIKPVVKELAIQICNHHIVNYNDIKDSLTDENAVQFMTQLYNLGFLEF